MDENFSSDGKIAPQAAAAAAESAGSLATESQKSDPPASQWFKGRKIGVCIKDASRKVEYQNDACLDVCGDVKGKVCKEGCMDHYVRSATCPALNEGARVQNGVNRSDGKYDIVVLEDGSKIVSLLYPLNEKHRQEMDYLKGFGLSKRELEVMSMIIAGSTNSEVAKKLCISKATLKTHLNNIYKKLPMEAAKDFKRRNSARG